jgi:hypothetical protein
VRLNGRVYETITARVQRRRPSDLFHTALTVQVAAGRFIVENAWPSPDADTESRGVVFEGPVFSRRLSRFRPFRYEVRCWRDGVIPDLRYATAGPQVVSQDPAQAQMVLDLVSSLPPLIWGRDERDNGEMWNSNSVISWLLCRAGLPIEEIRPPQGGRAPGWQAGIAVADAGPG